jgi:hypothetical protein
MDNNAAQQCISLGVIDKIFGRWMTSKMISRRSASETGRKKQKTGYLGELFVDEARTLL